MTGSLPLPLSLDLALAIMLVVIGLGVLLARDLFQSIVLFIIFGMLMAVVWCRLDAVDVALAEAAIGAGVTGALLVSTLYVVRQRQAQSARVEALPREAKSAGAGIAKVCAAVLFVAVFVLGLAACFVPLAHVADAAVIATGDALPHTGVENPVTAVLLSFRAYDTLLEVVVLLAALLAARAAPTEVLHRDTRPISPVLRTFTRILVPLVILVSVYTLWIGTKAPGGAFQSAAILAAAGVLMIVCGARPPRGARRRWRVVLVGGPGVFLLVGWGGVIVGGRFLELSPRWSGLLIVLIETALAASIALILVLLFSDTSSRGSENGEEDVEPESGAASGADGGRVNDMQEAS